MLKEIAKVYRPKDIEDRIYNDWLQNNYFEGKVDYDKEPFSIVIPPPNITGELHMGHALDNAIQDVLIRWKRMQGYSALWMPGTDHASIATEVKIVEDMAKENLTKKDIGREAFLDRAWEWKNKYGGRITEQLKKLGSSLDWSKERFTMDEGCSRAVTKVFINLYEKGLIYQGDRIINWCPDCKTALSDAEVEHQEHDGNFWYIYYPIKNSDEKLIIATTRPETMLGDTALAVHPEDDRYKHLIGEYAILPILNRVIPIVADEYVDREFGTGVVKITPAHDPNDFDIGLRHDLDVIRVMDDSGIINKNGGHFEGLDRYEARDAIVKELKDENFLVKVENHTHSIGHCYRCDTVVEPIVSKQWFVKMEPLAKPAIDAVKENEIEFIPRRFEKIYFNWMDNIKDWCISRQLWWGHRIPAYYCQNCNLTVVSSEKPDICRECSCKEFKQDEDVLDTWFSSALWPFSTLGWPDKTEELNYFYPTSVLVTGYDIIFFWVARMIFSGIEHMGEIPFEKVFIHGIVRDSDGRKMSKSLGNGIDPLEVIDEYGADALRLSLLTGNSPGNDMRFFSERVEASRNFANKIWNAARFILLNLKDNKPIKPEIDEIDLSSKWILSRLNNIISEVTENLDKYELGIAVQKLHDFIWNEFCDWYIELAKINLYGESDIKKSQTLYILIHVLSNSLKLLHPFMPFITEEIWSFLDEDNESIMISPWPLSDSSLIDNSVENQMNSIMNAIREVRNLRAEMNVPISTKTQIYIQPSSSFENIYDNGKVYFERLANANKVIIINADNIPENSVSVVTDSAQLFIPLEDLIDIEKEFERLNNEKKRINNEIKRAKGKLSNEGFIKNAPEKIVEDERQKLIKYDDMLIKIDEQLRSLSNIKE